MDATLKWSIVLGIVVIVVIPTAAILSQIKAPSHVQYRDSAPDGWYVQDPYHANATMVWFPIDEHYPGTLLGWWRLADGVNMTVYNGLFCFYLKNNIIMEAYLLKVWNSTIGEWQN